MPSFPKTGFRSGAGSGLHHVNWRKVIGPGLLFATSAIGSSHLVLSTRAGAHYGFIFFWIIGITLLLKYPFFEFATRYTAATGRSILYGYRQQGKWAVVLYLLVVLSVVFTVTGALAAVCGGLLSAFGLSGIPVPVLVGSILVVTILILLIGRFAALDVFMKGMAGILFVTVLVCFVAVVFKGPVRQVAVLPLASELLSGNGLLLTVSLVGFMPTGVEASVFQSVWVLEKEKTSNYRATIRESLVDFNIGYGLTSILALMFMTIGAFTVYGSGQLLEGNATQFSTKLLKVFSTHLGGWSFSLLAIAAFSTMYSTLITALDAFVRSFVQGVDLLKSEQATKKQRSAFFNRAYTFLILLVCGVAFFLFSQFPGSMIRMLESATVINFLVAPVVATLNYRSIMRKEVPLPARPGKQLTVLARCGLVAITLFAGYYLFNVILT
jgi:Mn2+/Fe2+ NRAMP family transporter